MPANNAAVVRTMRRDGIEKSNNKTTGQGLSGALRMDVLE
jgi:hypothetical protein